MLTAVYLNNQVPHMALSNCSPYMELYGNDPYPGSIRVIGARSFVHVETHTKQLEPRGWEGRLVEYSKEGTFTFDESPDFVRDAPEYTSNQVIG